MHAKARQRRKFRSGSGYRTPIASCANDGAHGVSNPAGDPLLCYYTALAKLVCPILHTIAPSGIPPATLVGWEGGLSTRRHTLIENALPMPAAAVHTTGTAMSCEAG